MNICDLFISNILKFNYPHDRKMLLSLQSCRFLKNSNISGYLLKITFEIKMNKSSINQMAQLEIH